MFFLHYIFKRTDCVKHEETIFSKRLIAKNMNNCIMKTLKYIRQVFNSQITYADEYIVLTLQKELNENCQCFKVHEYTSLIVTHNVKLI